LSRIELHTPETAPPSSRPIFERVIEASPGLPFILNIWAAMAESALTLEAYMALREAIEHRATLDPRVRSAVSLAVGDAIGGRYSPAINERIAARAGWSPAEIGAFRRGESQDARLRPLLALVREAATAVGHVTDATWLAARSAGWAASELAEAFTIVMLVTFIDGFANFAEVEPDAALQPAGPLPSVAV